MCHLIAYSSKIDVREQVSMEGKQQLVEVGAFQMKKAKTLANFVEKPKVEHLLVEPSAGILAADGSSTVAEAVLVALDFF